MIGIRFASTTTTWRAVSGGCCTLRFQLGSRISPDLPEGVAGGIGNRNLFEITLAPNFSGNKGGLFECRGWENMNGVVKLSIQRTFAGEMLLQNLVTVGPLHFFSVFKSSSLNRLLTRVRYSQLDQICIYIYIHIGRYGSSWYIYIYVSLYLFPIPFRYLMFF